ncbi:hypothetical protein FLO80_03895 [Aquicoccus porphyridii]|uniref:Uncharacterized protein n=1 Tax=Aquicoccus porphyridii TaxID=1852029 RepID=A0A5A9ZSV6_9RHOB|nr:hypothetical protein [Aquicoccus porphyridii]KAA0920267.1 hypothetical protein FLO80_03895 [Aquicoccus porphyridii]RAI54935.1 hypothetical protein DOO74_06885 [Rhodobacteraceae bacterium AsT-22]
MMQQDTLNQALEALERRIENLPDEKYRLVQKDLHNLVECMLKAGLEPPERVIHLEKALMDAAIEAQFDNMPV